MSQFANGRSILLNLEVNIYLKAKTIITKGGLYYLVRVTDIDVEIPTLQSIPVVCEFLDYFPNELPGILLDRLLILG